MVLDVGSLMKDNLEDAQRALIVYVTLKVWLFWPMPAVLQGVYQSLNCAGAPADSEQACP